MKLRNLLILPVALAPVMSICSCQHTTTLDKLEQDTIAEFKQIANYPHPSDEFLYEKPNNSNCLALSNYLKDRVKQLTSVEVNQDKYANLWFDIPCNDDNYKDYPTIALQCHMDMVFSYDPTKFDHQPDPMTTPIELVEDVVNGMRVIHSKDYKTTIGGDNGIGIAAILALIANKDVKHGNLRIIFTNCEENAMQGAMMLVDGHRNDAGVVVDEPTAPHIMKDVKYVLNLDTGISKSVCVSSSGAVGSHYSKTISATTPTLPNKFILKVSGFQGGHSAGVPRSNLGNAIKAAFEVLTKTTNKQFEIASVTTPGVTVYNMVASNCDIAFATDATQNDINTAINTVFNNHKEETAPYYWKDIKLENFKLETTSFDKVISIDESSKLITLHDNLWYGFDKEAWKSRIKTSANVGPSTLSLNDNGTEFNFKTSSYSRSDDDTRVSQFKQDNLSAANAGGYTYLCDAQFHPWVRDTNTKLLDLTKDAIANALSCSKDEIAESEAHGGLECTWWSHAMKQIEHVNDGASSCLGINVLDEHKFTESINVDSIKDCMKAVLYIFEHSNKLI